MSDRVTRWLEQLDLGQYANAFAENAIDWNLLPELDQETLKDIGVSAAGHRLRILKAIASLQTKQSSAPALDTDEPVETAGRENGDEVDRYAQALEDYTRAETLPRCDFFHLSGSCARRPR